LAYVLYGVGVSMVVGGPGEVVGGIGVAVSAGPRIASTAEATSMVAPSGPAHSHPPAYAPYAPGWQPPSGVQFAPAYPPSPYGHFRPRAKYPAPI
jgi:hypothetical protein